MRSKSKELKKNILEFAESYYFQYHASPSTSEISVGLGISRSTAFRYLTEMSQDGMLQYESGNIQTARIRKFSQETGCAPLIGNIACGLPQLEEEFVEEYVSLPVSLFGKGDFFLLRADGDSMIGSGIQNGDLVVIDRSREAHPGDIIVALVDHQTTTLKRFFMDDERQLVILHPENDTMKDQYYKDIEIQGVAVHVIKKLQ